MIQIVGSLIYFVEKYKISLILNVYLKQHQQLRICCCMILHNKLHYGYCNVTPFCVHTSFSEEVSRSPICIFKVKYLVFPCMHVVIILLVRCFVLSACTSSRKVRDQQTGQVHKVGTPSMTTYDIVRECKGTIKGRWQLPVSTQRRLCTLLMVSLMHQ